MALDPRQLRRPFISTPRMVSATAEEGDSAVAGATAKEFSERRFGGPTRGNSTTFTLTTTPQVILAGNPRRVFWSVINRGVVNAAIDIDGSMTFATGTPIGAAGGYAQMDVEEDGETVGWSVFGACESGTCVLRIYEVMRV